MAKRKKRKGKTMIYKTIHTKIKDRGTRTPLNTWDEHGYYSVNDAPTLSMGDILLNSIENPS
jgi:hypothetical protein